MLLQYIDVGNTYIDGIVLAVPPTVPYATTGCIKSIVLDIDQCNITAGKKARKAEVTIKFKVEEKIVLEFIESFPAHLEKLYECTNLSCFGTSYRLNQFVILPESKNSSMSFGKIVKLLCCSKSGYILYQKLFECHPIGMNK